MSRLTKEEIECIRNDCFDDQCLACRVIKQQSADIDRLCKCLEKINNEIEQSYKAAGKSKTYLEVEELLKEIRE